MDAQNYPGQGLSLLQLVFALNEELKRTAHSSSACVVTILGAFENAGCANSLRSITLETVSQLDRGTSTALGIIREWKNSFVHINRIPLEVLSLIPIHLSSQKDRLSASYVCRRWREAFLQCAEVWSRLKLPKGMAFTKTLLGRVKGSALDITTGFGVPFSTMMLLSSHTKQIRYLSFENDIWANIQAFSKLISGPLPLLHTLIVAPASVDLPDNTDRTPLPPLFRTAVNLKVLHVQLDMVSPPPLSLFAFPKIVSFKFSTKPLQGFPVIQLLDFLEGSPMLRTVDISIYSELSFEHVPQERVVLLPEVETFRLTVARWLGFKIATLISCPSAKHTRLARKSYKNRTIPEGALPTMGSWWNTIVRQYMLSPAEQVTLEIEREFHSGQLTFWSPDQARIELFFDGTSPGEDWWVEDPLRIYNAHQRDFVQAAEIIRHYPQPACIKRLHIFHNYVPKYNIPLTRVTDGVLRIFRALKPLDELIMHRCDLEAYFHPLPNTLEGHTIEPVVFPPIKELTISHPVYSRDDQFKAAIMGLAKSHHAQGIPLGRVIIRSEDIPVGMEEGLKPWVGSVECWCEDKPVDD